PRLLRAQRDRARSELRDEGERSGRCLRAADRQGDPRLEGRRLRCQEDGERLLRGSGRPWPEHLRADPCWRWYPRPAPRGGERVVTDINVDELIAEARRAVESLGVRQSAMLINRLADALEQVRGSADEWKAS